MSIQSNAIVNKISDTNRAKGYAGFTSAEKW